MMINKSKLYKTYLTVAILGKAFKLNVEYKRISEIKLDVSENKLNLFLPLNRKNLNNDSIINTAIKQLYEKLAEEKIEYYMESVRYLLGFSPDDYRIARLDNMIYRCVGKNIIINPDIIQYSEGVIYTTIIQAFCKAKYRFNTSNYKTAIASAMKKYEANKLYKFEASLLKIS